MSGRCEDDDVEAAEWRRLRDRDTRLALKAAGWGDAGLLLAALDAGRAGADCTTGPDGRTPIMLAALGGHTLCVAALIDRGAHVDAASATGTRPLFYAAQSGSTESVDLLIKSGAQVNAENNQGGTAVFLASQCGHVDIVRRLHAAGGSLDQRMADGATPLLLACQNGQMEIATFLLQRGVQADCARGDGATPLWMAAQNGYGSVVRLLLSHGARRDPERSDGATALFKAAHKGHADVVAALLDDHQATSASEPPTLGLLPNGESALHAAALFDRLDIVKALLAAGADARLANQAGETPGALAAHMGHDRVVQCLEAKRCT